MKTIEKSEEVKARIRKDLRLKGLRVPIGENDMHGNPRWVQCRWLNLDPNDEDNEQFQVFSNGAWKEAESIDFEFSNEPKS